MGNLAANVTMMDWRGWVKGLVRSVVTGGTSSLGAFLGVSTTGIVTTTTATVHVMWITFAFGAGAHLIVFLNTHPLPDDIPCNPT
jgi:zinc transporter ZupT